MLIFGLSYCSVKLEVALFDQFVEQVQNFIANHDGYAESSATDCPSEFDELLIGRSFLFKIEVKTATNT